jgi:hypothetical protein
LRIKITPSLAHGSHDDDESRKKLPTTSRRMVIHTSHMRADRDRGCCDLERPVTLDKRQYV